LRIRPKQPLIALKTKGRKKMLLKIYLTTIVLGLIAMIVMFLEVKTHKYYIKEVLKDLGADEDTFKNFKLPLSARLLNWIKNILYVVTPIINVILFIALFFPNREEWIKEGIRKSVAEGLKYTQIK
jgi:hypothetical protein